MDEEINNELPLHLQDTLLKVRSYTSLHSFLLYGSFVADAFFKGNHRASDLDIAVTTVNESVVQRTIESLSSNGFKIHEYRREYIINLVERVRLVYAEKDELSLDIGFLSSAENIGQFDAETMICRFPQRDIVDKYGAKKAIENRRLTPVRGLFAEDPHLLVSRFVYLCAKYDMPLDCPEHQAISKTIEGRLEIWRPQTEFQSQTKYSAMSNILKSILSSSARTDFAEALIGSNLVSFISRALEEAIKASCNSQRDKLEYAKDKNDLASLFLSVSKPTRREELSMEFLHLQKRKWNSADRQIKNQF